MVNGVPVSYMEYDDTDPRVSMTCGVKFNSSWNMYQYAYNPNIAALIWKDMHLNGICIILGVYESFLSGEEFQARICRIWKPLIILWP